MIKSYRGLLADGGQDKIRLTTTDGRTGYRVVKFQMMSSTPGLATTEQVTKIFKSEQTTIDGIVNFSDSDLLGASYWSIEGTSQRGFQTIIFDQEIFNQDIYVTYKAVVGTDSNSYYIELEQIKLSSAQAEVLIVKDLRKQPWTRP